MCWRLYNIAQVWITHKQKLLQKRYVHEQCRHLTHRTISTPACFFSLNVSSPLFPECKIKFFSLSSICFRSVGKPLVMTDTQNGHHHQRHCFLYNFVKTTNNKVNNMPSDSSPVEKKKDTVIITQRYMCFYFYNGSVCETRVIRILSIKCKKHFVNTLNKIHFYVSSIDAVSGFG